MTSGICRHQNAPAVPPPPGSDTLSDAGDNTTLGSDNITPKDGEAINPNADPALVATISIEELRAIKQQIADLQAAA